MPDYDAVIIGAGHNGLGLASYLAKSGLDVIVLEARPKVGGFLRTEEVLLPGYKHNLHAMTLGSYPPIYNDFDLRRYGVAFVEPPVEFSLIMENRALTLYRHNPKKNFEAFARFSKKDARVISEIYQNYARTWFSEFYSPPLMGSPRGEGLPNREEYVRLCSTTLRKATDELFESEEVKLFILLRAIELTAEVGLGSQDEDYVGTGDFLFRMVVDPGYRLTVGGNQLLAEGLARSIRAHGGTVHTSSPVRRIIVKRGRATGVELENGKVINSRKLVASSSEFANTLLNLLGEEYIDKSLAKRIRGLKSHPVGGLDLHLALNKPPIYSHANDADASRAFGIYLGYTAVEDIDQAWRDIRQGLLPKKVMGQAGCPSLYDASYAPRGKHVMYFWHFLPQNVFKSEAEIEGYTEVMLEQLHEFAPNLDKRNILGVYAYDALKWPQGATRARLAVGYDQYYENRPLKGYSDYRTPIEGLYMCGSDCHPGSAVRFAPAYNALQTIAGDFGLDKWWSPLKYSGVPLSEE